MHENQRIHAAAGNQPRSHHGLTERCGRGQHACVVLEQRLCRYRLLRAELATKGDVDTSTRCSLIAQNDANPERIKPARGKTPGSGTPQAVTAGSSDQLQPFFADVDLIAKDQLKRRAEIGGWGNRRT